MQLQETGILTLALVTAQPELATNIISIPTGEDMVFRPLMPDDDKTLAAFLENLSSQTREFYSYPAYDLLIAREMCDAINRYDKLRMVATVDQQMIALFEFSLCITESDKIRYSGYGIELNEQIDIRFGPCIADEYQNHGVGSLLLPFAFEIARRFGKQRMILWGGVLADNHRAIRYYMKNGFQILGSFNDSEGLECYDGIVLL